MRDPDATVRFVGNEVIREVRYPLPRGHFLRSELAKRWVGQGRLTAFQIVDDRTLASQKVEFVSYPTEWCDAQVHDAASLTLDLADDLLDCGVELKDASAWNVIFDGCSPVFCDLLSFQPISSKRWWAFGQYVRHFALPLWLARAGRLHANEAFMLARDGMGSEAAKTLLGWRRFDPRCAMLLPQQVDDSGILAREEGRATGLEATARYRRNLHQGVRWSLAAARPRAGRRSVWANYEDERGHYGHEELDMKRSIVRRWLEEIRPAKVLDLGCNAGEFSEIACEAGARVIAIDADHEAVQRAYRRAQAARWLSPVVARLDDLCGGRGWAGVEHAGLVDRLAGQCDAAFMLALMHHLAVAASVPLREIATLAHRLTRRWLIAEWVGEGDSQMQLLCRLHRRQASEFSVAAQRQAFANAGFTTRIELPLGRSGRMLALLERTAAT